MSSAGDRQRTRAAIGSATAAGLVALTYALPHTLLARVGDLPAHPLVVHLAVILLPVSGIAVVGAVLFRAWWIRYHLPIIAVLAVSVIAALVARSSGESLAAVVGVPPTHSELGHDLVRLALVLFVGLLLFTFVTLYRSAPTAARVVGAMLLPVALSVAVLTFFVGHSGATSVWSGLFGR
jgi:hypothetical protein